MDIGFFDLKSLLRSYLPPKSTEIFSTRASICRNSIPTKRKYKPVCFEKFSKNGKPDPPRTPKCFRPRLISHRIRYLIMVLDSLSCGDHYRLFSKMLAVAVAYPSKDVVPTRSEERRQ